MRRAMLFAISAVMMLSTALPALAAEFPRDAKRVFVRGTARFVAADLFIVNHPLLGQVPGIVKISSIGNQGMPTDNFEKFLLGKTEMDVPATMLTRYPLQKMLRNSAVLELTGFKPLQLSYVYEMLAGQPNGESGLLLTNGDLNWFHVRGTDGRVWLVSASWPDGARSTYPTRYSPGSGWWLQAITNSGHFVLLPGSYLISF